MNKLYISLLPNNKVYVLEDGIFKVEDMRQPAPDCIIPLGDKLIYGTQNIFKTFLGYSISDLQAFREWLVQQEPMGFDTLIHTIHSKNITGQTKAIQQEYSTHKLKGYSDYICYLHSVVPDNFRYNISECDLTINLNSIEYISNNHAIYMNNIIVYINVTERDIENIKLLYSTLEPNFKLNNFLELKLHNGLRVLIISDTDDIKTLLKYFYIKITNTPYADGSVKLKLENNTFKMYFKGNPDLELYYKNRGIRLQGEYKLHGDSN